ncbi:hypothetical protein [uncultured Acinetobacter sp.]|nr:hypothetical protein [uncultured Acinetobacter sp.]
MKALKKKNKAWFTFFIITLYSIIGFFIGQLMIDYIL